MGEGLNETEGGRMEVEAGPHQSILCQKSFTATGIEVKLISSGAPSSRGGAALIFYSSVGDGERIAASF